MSIAAPKVGNPAYVRGSARAGTLAAPRGAYPEFRSLTFPCLNLELLRTSYQFILAVDQRRIDVRSALQFNSSTARVDMAKAMHTGLKIDHSFS